MVLRALGFSLPGSVPTDLLSVERLGIPVVGRFKNVSYLADV
jgi:hypothetical protein